MATPIYDAIYAYLANHEPLAGVGIYRQVVHPDAEDPCIRFACVGGDPTYTQDGLASVTKGQFAFDVWDLSQDGAQATAAKLRAALAACKTDTIVAVFLTGNRDVYDEGRREFGVEQDAEIWYNE